MKHEVFLLSLITVICSLCGTKKIRFISTEHPAVTYYNAKYMSYLNLTSRRYGRMDPKYYVDLNFELIRNFDNNISIDFYFYEFLTNRYKRSFVEMHFKFCDMILSDPFFGLPMKQGKLAKRCPYPPGQYHLSNMTIPLIPQNFPFTKGRIYCNFSSAITKEIVGAGYIDMEIKEVRLRGNKSLIHGY